MSAAGYWPVILAGNGAKSANPNVGKLLTRIVAGGAYAASAGRAAANPMHFAPVTERTSMPQFKSVISRPLFDAEHRHPQADVFHAEVETGFCRVLECPGGDALGSGSKIAEPKWRPSSDDRRPLAFRPVRCDIWL
jgi:hypothetical protein